MLPDLKTPPERDKLNSIYESAFAAGHLFLRELKGGGNLLAGCVTRDPKTTEVADGSGGLAHVLATTKNLLVIADILIVNKGFAQQHPPMVAGLVGGLMEGNRLVRDNPAACLRHDRQSLQVGPDQGEDVAKFTCPICRRTWRSFPAPSMRRQIGGIYQSAIYAYGSQLIKDPADSDRFADVQYLKALEQSGAFKDQQIAIAPIRGSTAPVDGPAAEQRHSVPVRSQLGQPGPERNLYNAK